MKTDVIITSEVQNEIIVGAIAKSFGYAPSEEKIAEVARFMTDYTSQDCTQHLITIHSLNPKEISKLYSTVYLTGDICVIRTHLVAKKLKEMNLPTSGGLETDFLTVLSVLAAIQYWDYTSIEGNLQLMSRFMHWVYA